MGESTEDRVEWLLLCGRQVQTSDAESDDIFKALHGMVAFYNDGRAKTFLSGALSTLSHTGVVPCTCSFAQEVRCEGEPIGKPL